MPTYASFADSAAYLLARDAGSDLTPNTTQRNTLIVAAVYILVIAILWHVPYLNMISEWVDGRERERRLTMFVQFIRSSRYCCGVARGMEADATIGC